MTGNFTIGKSQKLETYLNVPQFELPPRKQSEGHCDPNNQPKQYRKNIKNNEVPLGSIDTKHFYALNIGNMHRHSVADLWF